MERIEIEVYSQATNQAIVRMPNRKFPGCVIQGDSLSVLADLAESIYEKAKSSSDSELANEARKLKDTLNETLLKYETVLGEHEIPLPYSRQPFNLR